MKTKKLLIFFTIGIILFGTIDCRNILAQNNFSEGQITKMLKSFYTSYITEISKRLPRKGEKADSIRREYCTAEMIKEFNIPELNFDPFVRAQMVLKECLNTLTIRKDSERDDLYYVTYNWPYGDKELTTIKLTVVKEKGSYKIDHVFLDNKENNR